MEEWREIRDFPGYSVSDQGHIRNDETGRILALLRNQQGLYYVGLSKNLVQHKRSVPLLVAEAFLPEPPYETFDTPINLDGDRHNNSANNLEWRPRWFAVKYFQQFHGGYREEVLKSVEEEMTGEWFSKTWVAATKYGLLHRELLVATLNRTDVWPTHQKFRMVSK